MLKPKSYSYIPTEFICFLTKKGKLLYIPCASVCKTLPITSNQP